MKILSLFDGMGCSLAALKNLGVHIDEYYSCEINPIAKRVVKKNYPEAIPIGDIRKIDPMMYILIDLIIISSPCQNLSNSNKKSKVGFRTKCGIKIITLDQYLDLKEMGYEFEGESYLFWESLYILREINLARRYLGLPEVKFIFENVANMSYEWKLVITKAIGVEPVMITASKVSAQNLKRYFWTNIQNLTIPEDRGITVSDVIPEAECAIGASGVGYKNNYTYPVKERKDGKFNCITTVPGTITKNGKVYGRNNIKLKNGSYRKITIKETLRIQGLPEDYFDGLNISKKEQHKMIGNGISVPVMEHLLICFFNEFKIKVYDREDTMFCNMD